jgi:hypothetical protein
MGSKRKNSDPSGNDDSASKERRQTSKDSTIKVNKQASSGPYLQSPKRQYASSLYQNKWNQLRTSQRPFGFPLIRAPLYKAFSSKALQRSQNTSTPLCGAFNLISLDTRHQAKGDAVQFPGPYMRGAFEKAFTEHDNGPAVVASRSSADPVLALGQDYWVQVQVLAQFLLSIKSLLSSGNNIIREGAAVQYAQ